MKKNRLLVINGIKYDVTLIPSDRRTISIRMLSSLDIEVRFPGYLSAGKAYDYVKGKSKWIEKKHVLLNVAEKYGIGGGVREGRILYFHGKPLEVKVGGSAIKVDESEITIPEGLGIDDINEWYRYNSEKIVARFIRLNRLLIPPCTISVKKQKNIWGSCNSKRRIYINSRISMLPPEVTEYVLWHEICHLDHMDHSKAFYKLLSEKCPGYKGHKAWLKTNSAMLRI
ncbi:MAG: M48 family metallopeptidase [Clostridia bacterium]|nr:M48 family metallopeptidase [Clostridia bacterium]